MGLKWSEDAQEITGEEKQYPYAHWWQTQHATEWDRDMQQKAFEAFQTKPSRFSGRIEAEIIGTFPFAEALPDLFEPGSLNPLTEPATDAPGSRIADLEDGDRIVAVIDDGAFFAHEKLRDPDNRVQVDWVWLQGASWRGPSDLVSGRELYRDDMDRLIDAHRHGDHVDEEALYRDVGLIDMAGAGPHSAALRQSHGMAVMDLLTGPGAGRRPGWPGAPQAAATGTTRVLWVSLPPRVTHDTSGTFIPLFALLALHETFKRIRALLDRPGAPRVPVAINMSYGLTAGPKDGTGLLGRYVEEKLSEWLAVEDAAPLGFFVPAGNTRLTQSRARIVPARAAADAGEPLYWHLPPDDPTPSFLEIWGPEREGVPAVPTLGVAIAPPGSAEPVAAQGPNKFDGFRDLVGDDGAVAMRAYARWVRSDAAPLSVRALVRGRECLILAAQPTRPDGPRRPDEPKPPFVRPGRWRIVPLSGGDDHVDVYVQRDDSLPGYPRRGRQSWLEDHRHVRRDQSGRLILTDPPSPGPILRAGTFNAIAAGKSTRIVAGKRRLLMAGEHRRSDPESPDDAPDASFSALGREDAAGWAEGSAAWPFLTLAGARSGSRVQVQGTSFAAPQAAWAFVLDPFAKPDRRSAADPSNG